MIDLVPTAFGMVRGSRLPITKRLSSMKALLNRSSSSRSHVCFGGGLHIEIVWIADWKQIPSIFKELRPLYGEEHSDML